MQITNVSHLQSPETQIPSSRKSSHNFLLKKTLKGTQDAKPSREQNIKTQNKVKSSYDVEVRPRAPGNQPFWWKFSPHRGSEHTKSNELGPPGDAGLEALDSSRVFQKTGSS